MVRAKTGDLRAVARDTRAGIDECRDPPRVPASAKNRKHPLLREDALCRDRWMMPGGGGGSRSDVYGGRDGNGGAYEIPARRTHNQPIGGLQASLEPGFVDSQSYASSAGD